MILIFIYLRRLLHIVTLRYTRNKISPQLNSSEDKTLASKTYVSNNRGVRSVVSSIFAWTILPCSTKCLPFQPWLFNAVDLIGFRFGSRESRGIRIPCLWNCCNKQQKPLNLLKSPPASKLFEQVVEFCLFVQSTKGIFICRRHCVLGCLAHSGFKLSELHPQTIEKLYWQLSCHYFDFDTFCLVSKSRDFIGARKINYFILIILKNTWSPKNTVRNLIQTGSYFHFPLISLLRSFWLWKITSSHFFIVCSAPLEIFGIFIIKYRKRASLQSKQSYCTGLVSERQNLEHPDKKRQSFEILDKGLHIPSAVCSKLTINSDLISVAFSNLHLKLCLTSTLSQNHAFTSSY